MYTNSGKSYLGGLGDGAFLLGGGGGGWDRDPDDRIAMPTAVEDIL